METNQEILQNYGFTQLEAEIYSSLVENGKSSIDDMMDNTDLSRSSIYDGLEGLKEKNLVNHNKQGRKAYYSPKNPEKLHDFIEEKKRETELMNSQMETLIDQFQGAYSLAKNKPGVRFFEGKDGFKEALWDSLQVDGELYTIADLEAVEEHVNEINKEYVEERRKRDINKKILISNTKASRKYIQQQGEELTDTKMLPKKMSRFQTGTQIYDGKVSYFTLRDEPITAMIVEDEDIYDMHKKMFEFLWQMQAEKDIEAEMTAREKMEQDLN
jgi:sugar-specific transcriptional regulator TrmB